MQFDLLDWSTDIYTLLSNSYKQLTLNEFYVWDRTSLWMLQKSIIVYMQHL